MFACTSVLQIFQQVFTIGASLYVLGRDDTVAPAAVRTLHQNLLVIEGFVVEPHNRLAADDGRCWVTGFACTRSGSKPELKQDLWARNTQSALLKACQCSR